MRIVLIGPPGSGKGTQAKVLEEHYNIPQVSTGDLLRHESQRASLLGNRLREAMSTGALVDDSTVMSVLHQRLQQADCQKGYILDGFPRTLQQACKLKELGIEVDLVVELNVDDATIIKRLAGRRIHEASGRVYHTEYTPPQIKDLDDITGEPLIQRADDREEVIQRRLAIYEEQTSPLTKYYANPASGETLRYIRLDVESWMLKGDVTESLLANLASQDRYKSNEETHD
ncbi:adenylate kinase [Photobacterium sp. OFAV2-7]|uniref:adenylate kinase n=1 Tax=Photobacterium sp. OFAV2-7 TaxID=2917748 RepID=UPI001EF5EB29|nr:adenylate kinase [Photobacterium sp. OFAV2-7]MCG7586830.1 adenylate kinase [Photobacterium sp. OFAV2-7]